MLAIGSIVAGYVGLPHVLGGSDWFARSSSRASAAPSRSAKPAEAAELELTLMAVSAFVAIGGIGIAMFLFLKHREAADGVAARFAGLHRLLQHKYYVDEIYDATIVQPIRIVSEEGLWKIVDARVIDGTVNSSAVWSAVERGAAADADRFGPRLRRLAVSGGCRDTGVLLWR